MKRTLFFSAFFFLALAASRPAAAQRTIVIANPSTHLDQLSTDEVRSIFTGAQTDLKGGIHLQPILLKDGTTQDAFLKDYIGKQDNAFRLGWRSLVFSGQGTMPRSADSDAQVVAFVAATPGAIGYISKMSPHDGVLTLHVR